MTALSRISLSRFRVALVVAAIALGGTLASLAPADTVPPTPTIALQHAVHFLTPAGEDLVVAPGTYEVDAAQEGLRLKPTGGKETEAVLVQAQALPHGESLTAPKVDVRPAGEDQYRVALLLPDGTSLEAVGSYSGVRTRGYGVSNTYYGTGALGASGLGGSGCVGCGTAYTNTTGQANTAMGYQALYRNTTASWNTAMGSNALVMNATGNWNTAVGFNALFANTTGSNNTAVGRLALGKNTGFANTALGDGALGQNTTGGSNIAIGGGAGNALVTGSNNIYVGNPGADESGTIRIGQLRSVKGVLLGTRVFLAGVAGVPISGSVVQVDANGQLGITPSSRRYKEAIENMGTASQGLLHLRPVTFRYKPEVTTGERRREYGLIAEEVAEVYPELVGRDAEGQIVTVQYHELIPMLLNELQQQHRQIEALTARVAEMEAK